MTDLKDDVLAALGKISSPDGAALPATGKLSDIVASDGKVFLSITVDAGAVKAWETVRERAEAAIRAVPGVKSVMVALTAERSPGAGAAARPPQRPQTAPRAAHAHSARPGPARPGPAAGAPQAPSPSGIPGVAAIIAVASGKGGVGKSTTAVNLALGLRDLGLKVGILDADIYGPSLPKLLAIRERPQTIGGTRLKPIERYGMPVMSIGFLIEEETPMIWRGPMVMSALTQMLREVEWGTLDVMVVDMPPGTGDAQLTMAQQVPLKGAVIVSTPQDLALIRQPWRSNNSTNLGWVLLCRGDPRMGLSLMVRVLWRFINDDRGATAIEYGLIAAGIAVAIIAVVQGLGTQLNTTFSSVSGALK